MYLMMRVQWTCTERINLIKTFGADPKIIHIIKKISISALIVNYCYGAKVAISTKKDFMEYATPTIIAVNIVQ